MQSGLFDGAVFGQSEAGSGFGFPGKDRFIYLSVEVQKTEFYLAYVKNGTVEKRSQRKTVPERRCSEKYPVIS